jgi:hypothetical protein
MTPTPARRRPVSIRWPDGTPIRGTDPTDVLARLGRLQWKPLPVEAMKRALSDRAWAWSATIVDDHASDAQFLAQLAEVKMVTVTGLEPWLKEG